MGSAQRAKILVGNGKPRMASKTPPACRHYQLLPSATIKPNESNILDSILDITAGVIDTQSGGPEGRCTTHTTHTVRHPRMFADRGSRQDIRHGGPWPPDPAFASFWAYGLISRIEGSYFGKEFLRMAGIVQMLHIHRPPYGAQSYIVVCQPNPNSTSTIDPYTHPRSSQIITRVGVHHSWINCQCVPLVSGSVT
jgi:hypothetical protein